VREIGFEEEEVVGREMGGTAWLGRWAQAPSSVGTGRSEGKDVSVLLALRQDEKGWGWSTSHVGVKTEDWMVGT
jgi:hypothetical protein